MNQVEGQVNNLENVLEAPGFEFTRLHNYRDPFIKSNNCKLNCIDENHFFCADPKFSTG